MKTKGLLFGVAFSFLAGWLGAGAIRRPVPAGETGPRQVSAEQSRSSLPEDLGAAGAERWLADLDVREIEQWILRLAKAPETGKQKTQILALFGRMFELDGTAAANLWLKIEADCQPELSGVAARWAARSPDEAVAWFGNSLDEIRRFRAGRLIAELAEEMIQAITERNPELGASLLMENPSFYDPGCLFSVGLELSSSANAALTEDVVRWAARQGDNPRNGLQTLSGDRLDAGGWGIKFLSSSNPEAAIGLYGTLPSGDLRRESWLDGIVEGWSERDRPAAMTWWIQSRSPDVKWQEGDLMPLMDWAREEPDEWLPWMTRHLPAKVADDAMAMAIDRTSPPSLMHLRLCAAIRSAELRAKMIAQIREQADLEDLREEVKGNEELEALLGGKGP